MEAEKNFHWSKDFVEHLRTVHFALAVVSIALIIADTNSQDTRVAAALTQIEQIAKFEKQWPTTPAKLYAHALSYKNIQTNWRQNIAIVLPRKIYRAQEIDTQLDVPSETILEPRDWKFSGKLLPAELTTLAEFRDFWHQMHQGLTLVLPEMPSPKSTCQEDIRTEHVDGSNDLSIGSAPTDDFLYQDVIAYCKVGAGLMNSIGGPKFDMKYELYSYGSSAPENENSTLMVSLDLPSTTLVTQAKHASDKFVALTNISLKTVKYHMNEKVLSEMFFNDWKQGDFADAFPELNSESSGISTLEIADAVHRMESQAASAEKSISLVGFTIPLSQVSRWGALVLLATQLYFWLHLHELVAKLEPDAEGWNVAWIGIYRTRTSFIVSIISACFIPIAASITLGMKIVTVESYSRRSALAGCVGVIVLSALLSSVTLIRMRILRRGAIDQMAPVPIVSDKVDFEC